MRATSPRARVRQCASTHLHQLPNPVPFDAQRRGAESAVKLPEGARPDNLTPALQKLGSIRDVDVVVDILTNAWERVAPEPPVGAQKSRQPQLPAQLVAIDMRDVLRDLDRVRTERCACRRRIRDWRPHARRFCRDRHACAQVLVRLRAGWRPRPTCSGRSS